MSLQALNWAMVQRCGTPAAKMVLIILSRFANAEGWAWPSRQTLAEATEQSPDSVDRALRLLTSRGLIEKGQRQIRMDGGASSVRYRLLFDAQAIDQHLAGNRVRPGGRNNERPSAGNDDTGGTTDPQPQIAAGGGAAECDGGSRNLRPGGAANCGLSQERKDSTRGIVPPTPRDRGAPSAEFAESGSGSGTDRAPYPEPGRRPRTASGFRRAAGSVDEIDPATLARFERLWSAYPESGRLPADRNDAMARFAALSPTDQDRAIAAAVAEARNRAEHRTQAMALHRWLGKDRWQNAAPAVLPGAPAAAPTRVFVRDGSPEWDAWTAHYRRLGRPMPTPMRFDSERADGWRFESRFPPGVEAA